MVPHRLPRSGGIPAPPPGNWVVAAPSVAVAEPGSGSSRSASTTTSPALTPLDDVATDARVLQPERPIAVDVAEAPVRARGDAFRLQQVLAVLVTNALVHTPHDASLRLSARTSDHGCIIVVADTGPGLDEADAERVFDRFYRGDQSRTRATGGAGLGLAIARSIVEAHGGQLTLGTAPGKDCAFTVRLPAAA